VLPQGFRASLKFDESEQPEKEKDEGEAHKPKKARVKREPPRPSSVPLLQRLINKVKGGAGREDEESDDSSSDEGSFAEVYVRCILSLCSLGVRVRT
jgi:hypothetical protein